VEIGSYLVSCGWYIERNSVRAGLARVAWEYRSSSAAAYVKQVADGVTDQNPYFGAFTEADRQAYGEVLMCDSDEQVIKSVEGDCAIGTAEFEVTLKMECGHYRVKRGRPVKNVRITL